MEAEGETGSQLALGQRVELFSEAENTGQDQDWIGEQP